MPLRVPSTHPSYLLAWKGHWGRCLGPALEHTALCHFFSGNFQVKMSLLSPQLSISLLCSFSPTRWSVRFMWETSPHPRAGDERDGDGEEGLPLPAAGAESGRKKEPGWGAMGCQEWPEGRPWSSNWRRWVGQGRGTPRKNPHFPPEQTPDLLWTLSASSPLRNPCLLELPPRPAKLLEQVG